VVSLVSTPALRGVTGPLDAETPRGGLRSRCIRLSVEASVLAGVWFTWVLYVTYAGFWAWATLGLGPRASGSLPWIELALPQLLGLVVVAIGLVYDLPTIRWSRSLPFHRPRTIAAVVACLPLLPIAVVLVWRDRNARRLPEPLPSQIEQAFQQLISFPRSLGLRFLLWAGLATLVDAILLGSHFGWPRDEIVSLACLWLAALGPFTAILIGRTRAVVRPEYLAAPRAPSEFRLASDLRLRLIVNGTTATLGIIIAPLCAGYLWNVRKLDPRPLQVTTELVDRIDVLTVIGAEEELGALLALHPKVVVHMGGREIGPQGIRMPPQEGRVDLDGDGRDDVVVRHTKTTQILAPIPRDRPGTFAPLLLGGLLAMAATLASVIIIAHDTHRDVTRATRQVGAVVRGQAPPPAHEGSFSTYEIRELVGSVDRLVQRITEANIASYVAIEKAREADRLKSQFLANMSHDLRSPLNSILGFSELLLSGIDGPLTAEQREMVIPIHENGRALLQQIDDILDTAKIEASRLDLHPEPTPAATLIHRAIHGAKKRQSQTVEYMVDAAAGLPPAFVDPYRTVQAIENVLLFASERMQSGRLDIRVRQGKGRRGRMIVVQIRTPVRPATAQQLARARRGFHRIPGHRGLGLGLPIAGSILELEGGALGIEDLGDGMVFSLQLCAPEARRLRDSNEMNIAKVPEGA